MARAAIVIPARYGSARFPGKPLALLDGPGGRLPLIRRTWDAARRVDGGHAVFVATDDARIAEAAADFGAEVLMTPATCANGTERCAEAARQIDADIVVNLQGDAPLTPPHFVTAVIKALEVDRACEVATAVLRADPATLSRLRADRAAGRVGGTTAVLGIDRRALYFSKEVLPFGTDAAVFHHVGLYAYTRAALRSYAAWSPGELETAEGLEQLRFLEHGLAVQCAEVDGGGRTFWEVNNPSDIPVVEAALREPAG